MICGAGPDRELANHFPNKCSDWNLGVISFFFGPDSHIVSFINQIYYQRTLSDVEIDTMIGQLYDKVFKFFS